MKKFIINLDLEIQHRYVEVIRYFKIDEISKHLNKTYKEFLPNIPGIDSLISISIKSNKDKIKYAEEIKYWSKVLGLKFHKVMLLQLIYELVAGCTTFVKDNIMYRSMDFPLPYLKDMTYGAVFVKNNKIIYEGVCWVGGIGIFTGSCKDYSIAINYRRLPGKNTPFEYVKKIFTKYSKTVNQFFPVSYLTRYIFENSLSRIEAFTLLNGASIIAPTYYILNYHINDEYPNPLNPVIFQRDSQKCKRLSSNIVIQTNHDINEMSNENISYSFERYIKTKDFLNSEQNPQELFTSFPILNEDTIYYSVIKYDHFETHLC